MKILLRITLVIFFFALFACKQERQQDQIQSASQIPDSILLRHADAYYDSAEKISDPKRFYHALNLHLQALAIRESILNNDIKIVNSLYKVGRLYLLNNKPDVADKYLEKARGIAETINAPFPIIYEIYRNLASCKIENKDFPTASSIAQRLLRLIDEHEPESKSKIASVYSTSAIVYHYQGDDQKAIATWLEAAKLVPSDHAFLGRIYYSISAAYSGLKEHKHALDYINKSVKQDLIWAGAESQPVADKYLHKAFVLLELQRDSVPYFLRQTLRIRKKVYGEKHSYTYGIKRSLGDFYNRTHRYDSAVFYHHESLISLIRKFNDHNFTSNPRPESDEINSDLTESLVRKAEVVARLSKIDSSSSQLLDLSLNTYILADSVFTAYRRNILHDDPLLQQMERRTIPYSSMLDASSELLARKKSVDYFEKAFHVMESSRSFVLQSALNRAMVSGSVGISDTLIKSENRFNRIRAEVLQKLSDLTLSRSVKDSLNEVLLDADNREADLQNELKRINPNYFSVKYGNLPSIAELRKILAGQNSVYLGFMWSDSAIYALMISENSLKLKSIPIDEEFKKAFDGYVNEFRSNPEGAVKYERYKNFCANSWWLYDRLVKELIDNIDPKSRIIVSADGPLATIPFEAFTTRHVENEEVNYHLPYLMLGHPISYAYSAGVLLKQYAHLREGKKLLAFGYAGDGPARATRSGLTNLPGTEKELQAIKDVMHNDVNQYKLRAEASEAAFKKQVAEFDIVHLAVHGEGDTLNSLNSRLIFRAEADTVEDGSLYAHELYDLNLSKLDLAVLSACESGIGKQQVGEGLMSIARGFAYAGCPSLVISLWKINDRTSAQVMRGFYNHLVAGEPLDISLANAKADYLKSAGEFNSHPFYWAAFLQVGNVEKLDVQKPNWWGWVLGGLGTCLVIYFIIAFRKR
jgi:CHAT domain-containing protein/tetratricopeptide (TPR) repeat protein